VSRNIGVGLLAGGLAVLHLVLGGRVGVGVVRALVVADVKGGVSGAETVVVIASALRVLCRLLRNAKVQNAMVQSISVRPGGEPSKNLILRLSSACRGTWSYARSSAALSGSKAEGSGQDGKSGELHG
jgi:hypothetical protein